MSILKLFRSLGEAALEANLSKNEAKVFQHLINKTLTFYKLTADQTDSTIVYFTRIRQDRAKQAIESLLEKGFFTRTPIKIHSKRGWVEGYRYHIAPAFLTGIDADFFGSDNPKSRPKNRPKFGNIHRQNNTNNKQHNSKATPNPTKPTHHESGRRSDLDLVKPQNVDLSTYENLLPALFKLKTPQAQNVLDVLSVAIHEQSIKTTPIRLGFGLINQAKAGQLNTACLQIKQQQQQKAQVNQSAIDRALHAAELNGLRQQAKLLGIPLEQHARNLNQMHLLRSLCLE